MILSWLLALAAVLPFYSPLLFMWFLCDTKNCRLLILGYLAGGSFYIILPSFLPIILGEQIINLSFSSDAYFGSEILDKVYSIIIVYSIFSSLGLFLGFGVNGKRIKKELQTPHSTNNKPILLLIFLISLILSCAVTIQGLKEGVVSTGERGQGLPTSLMLVLNNTLIVSMALLMDVYKGNRYKIIFISMVFLLLFVQSALVSGSRRIVAFFFLFVVTPVLLRLRVVGKLYVGVAVPLLTLSVIVFGVLRKGLNKHVSVSDIISELPSILIELKNNIDLLLMNADFAIIFDAFIGVLKKVPDQVDYLYGDTFLKIFYFMIPRTVWPSKPQTISVIVSDRIYDMDSTLVSFSPNLLGEMFFNGGYVSVAIVGIIIGMLLGRSLKYGYVLCGSQLSYTVIFGVVSMSFFNLWRGYTFEVIFNLFFLFFILYFVKFITSAKKPFKLQQNQGSDQVFLK